MIVCSDMTLLRRFYGSENGLNLSSERASVLEHIAQGAKRIDAREAVFYLSAYYQKSVRYYVVCSDPLLMSHLSLWLNSALGTARNYVVRTQTQSELNYEQVLYERYPHGVLCIEQLPVDAIQFRAELNAESKLDDPFAKLKSDKAFIERRIEQTLWRWKQQPLINQTVKRPLGRLLRDLLLACEERQLQLAQNTYWEIRERQLLEQRNLIAVELQVHAAGEQWSRIVTHSELDWLLQGMVSKRVNEIVLEAFARHLHLDVENLSVLNWVALAERLLDQQGFFLRRPNLANSPINAHYWQYWAVFATALGHNVETVLPEWLDSAWVARLVEARAQLFEVNPAALTNVETSPINQLLAQSKTLENAMQVVEYALRCYEHELPNLISWLFSLSAEDQKILSSTPLLSKRWSEWEHRLSTTCWQKESPQSFWRRWFNEDSVEFWLDEDITNQQLIGQVDFSELTRVIHEVNKAELILDRLPIFLNWMNEQKAPGTSEFWLELVKVILLEELTWCNQILLEKVVNSYSKLVNKETWYRTIVEVAELSLESCSIDYDIANKIIYKVYLECS
ncbi:hypothetical protein [Vibrio cyclitrophicus]|uniref:hypothetical protein n=1 Tax=Vibrio cyclitrophicus TaxID=47951 RepID=UPI0002F0D997|nr:hypothetical protein [Vibrio cyclitrophicus]OED68634.1 hypothetical protein OAU_10965 [Vibrio cyclitrophicus ZF99]PME23808.1 hypothetical protein BCV43_00250 [Vibrio cyclitrophicus]